MLAALLPLAAAPVLHLTRGDKTLTIPVSLELSLAGKKSRVNQPLELGKVGGAVEGEEKTEAMDASLRALPEGAGVGVTLVVHHTAAGGVEREAVSFTLPGEAWVVDRTLGWAPLEGSLRVDRGTPIVARAGGVLLVADRGFVAARYLPAHGDTRVELIVDDADAHPFSVYEQCLEKLPPMVEGEAGAAPTPTPGSTESPTPSPSPSPSSSPMLTGTNGEPVVSPTPMSYRELEKRKPMSWITRGPGDSEEAHATLYLVGEEPVTPLVVERWPGGAKAAVVFTDHADRTDAQALKALLQGTSDEKDPAYGKRGFFGHGLKVTKSFFAHGSAHGTLEKDPQAAALAKVILAAGSEVASHTVTPGPDPRSVVKRSLPVWAEYHAVTWIDHEPYTNCEAVSNQGWETKGPYGIRDLLAEGGFGWIWAATDVAGFVGNPRLANLFTAGPATAGMAPAYPFPLDPAFWLFRSTWFYDTPEKLGHALDSAALDKLERERGLFVGHTYLSASKRTTRNVLHQQRLAVREGSKGSLEIEPALDAGLARLGERVAAGSIASLTWQEAGERLRALDAIRVTYLADGRARVENAGKTSITGLTVALPLARPQEGVTLSAAGAAGSRSDPGRSTLWLDLAAGASVELAARKGDTAFPLLPAAQPIEVTP